MLESLKGLYKYGNTTKEVAIEDKQKYNQLIDELEEKKALRENGAVVAETPDKMGNAMKEALEKAGILDKETAGKLSRCVIAAP